MELSQRELTRVLARSLDTAAITEMQNSAAPHSLTGLWCHPQAELHRSCAGHSLPACLGQKPSSVKQLFRYRILSTYTRGGYCWGPAQMASTNTRCSLAGAADNWLPGSFPTRTHLLVRSLTVFTLGNNAENAYHCRYIEKCFKGSFRS